MINKPQDIEKYLRQAGISPSFQRIMIYQYLCENRNHPDVDQIYQALEDKIPSLSRTTVYNSLKIFMDKQIVQQISPDNKQANYDADLSFHGHFFCTGCNRIYDFKLTEDASSARELEGFMINEKHLYYKGKCQNCLNKTKE